MIVYLLQGITLGFAAAVSPGPFQAYLISHTLSSGWRRTAPAAFAPLLSDGPIILLVLFTLSQMPAWLPQTLHVIGGFYLLYLAAGTLKTWRAAGENQGGENVRSDYGVMKAVFVNLLNPNPYLSWTLVMGPLLMKSWHEAPLNGIALLGAFYGTMIGGTLAILLLFAYARNLGPRVSHTLIGLSGLALGCLGLVQIWLGTFAHWWD